MDGEFSGNARFEIRRRLGVGGMGVVYQARDRDRGIDVALKTIRKVAPTDLYRFKKEFRALEDIAHPNLVRFWELFSEDGTWFFTMELVEGVDFRRYVAASSSGRPARDTAEAPTGDGPPIPGGESTERTSAGPSTGFAPTEVWTDDPGGAATDADGPTGDPSGPATSPDGPTGGRADTAADADQPTRRQAPDAPGPAPAVPFDEARLRSALVQLARGLTAIHATGRLHRDIKASNVMVDRDGRVVILDFGLAIEMARQAESVATENLIAGTFDYMSPEQAEGEPLTPASDWYSVGVLLYNALTGRFPFVGSTIQVMIAKQSADPTPPRTPAGPVPRDLESLCLDLLRRPPDDRPTGPEVLRRLGDPDDAGPGHRLPAAAAERPFVGRAGPMEALGRAYAGACDGRAVAAFVRGRSGAGKSTLVRSFLAGVARSRSAIILEGRCFEQETVAFKAMDALIDSLSQHLRRLGPDEVKAVLPRDIDALTRVFPVLGRVEAIDTAPRRAAAVLDPQEVRRRAFAALREMLARIGDRSPLILVIDDLQWGDLDSADLLAGLIRPPDPPSLLLLCCFRSEHERDSPCLARLLDGVAPGPDRVDVDVLPLAHGEARDLARILLRGAGAGDLDAVTDLIARESGGSPYFVFELARHLLEGREIVEGGDDPSALRLDEVLWARVQALPARSRRLLEAVAMAGRPIDQGTACRVAGLGADAYDALADLRSNHLVQSQGFGLLDAVETFHDRVRETVVARLAPEARAGWHAALAAELEKAGRADPETLAAHFEGAGDLGRAAQFHARAAAAAAEALAFDRAAATYRHILELGGGDPPGLAPLYRRLGEALAGAGRGAEAAHALLEAAARSPFSEAVALRGQAAYLLLMSGHIDEGIATFRQVLRFAGLRQPATPIRALGWVLVERTRLALRGLRPARRPAGPPDPEALAKVDLARGVAVGMSVVDVIQGAYYQTRSLRMALKLGDLRLIALAAGWEAVHSSTQGWPVRRRTARLIALARRVAAASGSPHAEGMATLGEGSDHYFNGRFRRAAPILDRASAIFRDRCTGVTWELDTAQTFAVWALFYQGEIAETARRTDALYREALTRGDRYMETNLGVYTSPIARLAEDDPARARAIADEAITRWSQSGFHVQHLTHFVAVAYVDLYEDDPARAWDRAERTMPQLRRSLLLRIEHVFIDVHQVRARAALAALAAGRDRDHLLRMAGQIAKKLDRRHHSWGRPVATLIRAGIARSVGDLDRAVALLREGIGQAEAAPVGLFAASARRHLGGLVGGDEGRDLLAEADRWMAGQPIRDPARMARSILPGFGD